MQDASVIEQFKIYGLSKEKIDADGVLILMDIFALPYKVVVLRLVESGIIDEERGKKLLNINSEYVENEIDMTGKAKRWQKNSNDLKLNKG